MSSVKKCSVVLLIAIASISTTLITNTQTAEARHLCWDCARTSFDDENFGYHQSLYDDWNHESSYNNNWNPYYGPTITIGNWNDYNKDYNYRQYPEQGPYEDIETPPESAVPQVDVDTEWAD